MRKPRCARARGELRALVANEGGFLVRAADVGPVFWLAEANDFAALHRAHEDQVYRFYAGDPAELILIDGLGRLSRLTLGVAGGQRTQVTVDGGVWRGLRLRRGGEWALMATARAPDADVERGRRSKLTKLFPQHRAVIARFTK